MRVLFTLWFKLHGELTTIDIELYIPCRINIGDMIDSDLFMKSNLTQEEKELVDGLFYTVDEITFGIDENGIYQHANTEMIELWTKN